MAIYTDTKNLNVIPAQSAPVVVHCSQGDAGAVIEFNLYKGAEPFVPTDAAVCVHGMRKDGTGFGPTACALDGNIVSVTLDSTMTGIDGPAVAEITITEQDGTISTANFAILVEPAAFPDGPVVSESVDVYTAILAYVQSFLAEAKADATTKVAAEKTEREAADGALQGNIDALETKLTTVRTGTFTAADWSNTAPYTQTILVPGITADSYPGWDVNTSSTSAVTIEALMEARNCISYIKTGAGTVTAYCATDKPAVNLPVFFKGV